jgi:hypothetical protein
MELNFKIKDLEKKNIKLQDENEYLNNLIKEKKNENVYLNEQLHNIKQPSSSDCMNYSYYLGDKFVEPEIKIDCPSKKDFQEFSEKFKTAEKNFNTFEKLLVETNNKAYEKFKQLYFKIKGKEWINSDNSFIKKLHYTDIFNIDQNIAWTNIFHIQGTIENIINEIFNLVDPTENCDPKKLNEDSCEFLLNYIIGLKKLFFLQKEILDNSFDFIEDYETKNKKLKYFRKISKDAENFFDKNDKILRNESYFEIFKDELNVEKTKAMSLDEYMENIKSVLVQAKANADRRENEFNEFKKKMEEQKKKYEDIEKELINEKNKLLNNNNGIKI